MALEASRAAAEHGQHIFIYAHVRTNQIIYSLNRAINNNAALKQLPYLGKGTVPATIRKDFWQPLATVTFPSGPQGLSAYQRLREFRKRHEHEWTAPRCKPRKLVGRELRDQKANSIADLAAVLLTQEKVAAQHAEEMRAEKARDAQARMEAEERLAKLLAERKAAVERRDVERMREVKREKMKLKRAMALPESSAALSGQYSPLNDGRPIPKRGVGRERRFNDVPPVTMEGIKIAWSNVLDAEFAATWPKGVVHDELSAGGRRIRNVPPKPDAAAAALTNVGEMFEEPVAETSVEPQTKEAQQTEWDTRTTMQKVVDRLRFGKGQ